MPPRSWSHGQQEVAPFPRPAGGMASVLEGEKVGAPSSSASGLQLTATPGGRRRVLRPEPGPPPSLAVSGSGIWHRSHLFARSGVPLWAWVGCRTQMAQRVRTGSGQSPTSVAAPAKENWFAGLSPARVSGNTRSLAENPAPRARRGCGAAGTVRTELGCAGYLSAPCPRFPLPTDSGRRYCKQPTWPGLSPLPDHPPWGALTAQRVPPLPPPSPKWRRRPPVFLSPA